MDSQVEIYFKNKRRVWVNKLLIKYKFLFKEKDRSN